jgi:hypothetical protein
MLKERGRVSTVVVRFFVENLRLSFVFSVNTFSGACAYYEC